MIIYGLLWFYGISIIVGYSMSNPFYAYIVNIYDLPTHFIDNIFTSARANFLCTQLNAFKYFYLQPIICLHTVKWFQ